MITRIWVTLALIAIAPFCSAETLRLAVTTSFHNSGLADILLPQVKQETGIEAQLLVVGTGQALRLGAAGDVDAILVHSKTAEEAFIAAGHGLHRSEIMYNDFVILGPMDDFAGVRESEDAAQALQKIAQNAAIFISRGDDSGTHKKEMQLWQKAQIAPRAAWYRPVGAGMGAALNVAVGMGGYILADRASWLNFGNKGKLGILFQGDPILFNQYAFIPVDPKTHPHVNAVAALQFESWLKSPKAASLIDGYEIQGQRLFTFNAVSQ